MYKMKLLSCTPWHSLHSLALLFFLFPLTLQAQCDVKVKAADQKSYDEALALYGERQYSEASKLMRRVAQHNPKSADPQFWLGMMSVNNGFNITGIRKYFTKCVELCENYPDALAHYYMGMIHYTDERYEEATAEFNRYFQLANNSERKEWTAVYEEASAYLHWSQFLADAELHRVPFDPVPLRGVSSKRNEDLPFLTPDGQRCYYLREMPSKKDRTSFYTSTTAKTLWKLFYSDWSDKDSAFDSGHELPAPFNQGASEGAISTTADGKELYFARMEGNNSDIYCAKWSEDNGKWVVEKLGNGINGDRTWESQPSVSADGHWLLFASNRPGGQGGSDLWRCHRLANGDWSRPHNLGARVNTTGNEKFPFLHADGHTLYFVSDGWQGFGGYDVYFIDLDADDGSYPTNLGLPINSEDDNLSFGVSADGLHAYFPGHVSSSSSKDILYFDLYPSARPEPMRLWRMQVTDTLGRPLLATVKMGNTEWTVENGTVCLMVSERYDNILTIEAEGYMPCFFRLRAKDVAHSRIGEGASLVPMSKNACSPIDLTDSDVLLALAKWLIDNPRIRIVVEGPTKAIVEEAYATLRLKGGLRPDRMDYRSGTDITRKQIRLQ